MSDKNWIRIEIQEIIVYLFSGVLLFVLLPMIGGFWFQGFQESFRSGGFEIGTYLGDFVVYFFFMIGALLLIIFPVARLFLLPRGQHPATQKDPRWWTIFTVSLIHSPEENGALFRLFEYFKDLFGFKKNFMGWSLSIFRITILSILFFGAFGILQLFYPQLVVSAVPHTVQQVSLTSDIIFGAGVPAFTENGTMLFIFFLLLGLNAWFCSKFKLGLSGFFVISFLFLAPLLGILWASTHRIVYGASEVSLFNTFIFGLLGSVMTLLFASFIPWLVWHFSNNAFFKLSKLAVAREDVIFIAVVVWVIVFVLYVFGEFLVRKYKVKVRDKLVIPT